MPRQPRRRPGEVERKVYFYRANIGLDESGRPKRFDFEPIRRKINALSFASGSRYLENGDGNATCCWIDGTKRLRIANVRRSGLPQVEQQGALQPLSIPASSGLVEETPVMFFQGNIVGVVFNFYGPRISRLAHYVTDKARSVCRELSFEPLVRPDIARQLSRLRDIRLFQLKINEAGIEELARADPTLGEVFRGAAAAGDAREVEVILRPQSYSRDSLATRMIAVTKRLFERSDVHDAASRFIVRGLDAETDSIAEIDLLNDKLLSKKTMMLANERSRALDPASAFAAIEEAYRELSDELTRASSIAAARERE